MNKRLISGLAALTVVFSGAAALPAGTFEGFSLTASAESTAEQISVNIPNQTMTQGETLEIDLSELIPGITAEQVAQIKDSFSSHLTECKCEGTKLIIKANVPGLDTVVLKDTPEYDFRVFSITISAKDRKGPCGENLTWELDGEGTLTISGTGNMSDFSFNNVPWYADRDNIKKVVIADGVTSIGKGAFQYLLKLESVSIPNSVVSIGREAFFVCEALADIAIPKSVTSIGDY
nr:leucine-rich repeat domain-containing protein [Ruminococcus sp.]